MPTRKLTTVNNNIQPTVFWLKPDSKLWHPKGPQVLPKPEEGAQYSKPAGTQYFSGQDIINQTNHRLPARVNIEPDVHGASAVDLGAIASTLEALFPYQNSSNHFYRVATPDEVVRAEKKDIATTLALIIDRKKILEDYSSGIYHSGSLQVELFDLSVWKNTNYTHFFIPTNILRVGVDKEDQHKVSLTIPPEQEEHVVTGNYQPSGMRGLTWTNFNHLVSNNFNINGGTRQYLGNVLHQGVGALSLVGDGTLEIKAGLGERSPIYGIPLAYCTPDKSI